MTTASSPHQESIAGFDELNLNRLRARAGVKWHRPGPEILAAWVADMDYPIAPVIAEALHASIDAGDLGYPDWPDGSPLRQAFSERMDHRYGWRTSPTRVREHTDLIQALQILLHLGSSPGAAVGVQTPNYPPFLATLKTLGRRAVPIPMHETSHGWRIDVARMAADLTAARCKVLLLVNPHNPTGRVLTRDELDEISQVASRLDLLVLSDEIHAELTYHPHQHIPFASLNADAAARTVTLTSASKSFNIAGLRCAVAHYGPDSLLAARDAQPPDIHGSISTLGVTATLAAWRRGDAWQRELIGVLRRNRDHVGLTLAKRVPDVRHHPPEATYLAWLNTAGIPLAGPAVEHVLRVGKVQLDGGAPFGSGADHFLRLNFATSAAILDAVLDPLCQALLDP